MARKYLSFSYAIDRELHAKINEIAQSEGQSMSNWVRRQLIKGIEKKTA